MRAVARAPANVRTKLLVAFLAIAALLVLVGVLGCASSARRTPASRGSAPCRSARRPTRPCRLGRDCGSCSASGSAAIPGRTVHRREEARRRAGAGSLVDGDDPVRAVAARAVDERGDLRLRPASRRRALLRRIRRRLPHVDDALHDRRARQRRHHRPQVTPFLSARSPPTTTCTRPTISPSGRPTRPRALIAANRSAYTSSRNLFIGVGAVSVAAGGRARPDPLLALIGPIQRVEARLAEISAGDFSGRSTCRTATSSARSAPTSTG